MFSKANLFKLKKALLQLAEVATEQGVLIYDGDTLEVGIEVFVDGEDGLTPASDGEYTYDGQIITVEGGKITDIRAKEIEQPTVEEPTVEEPAEPVVEEMAVEEPTEEPVVEDTTDDEKDAEIARLTAEIERLTAENEELKAKLAEPVAENAEMEVANPMPKTVTQTVKYDYAAMMRKAREINK